jgi:hypothetical protein
MSSPGRWTRGKSHTSIACDANRLCPTIGVEELAGAAVRFVLAKRKAETVLVLNDEIPDYFKQS